jgi:hypothetical protein
VLYNLAVVVEAKDVDPRIFMIAWPHLVTVEHDEIAFCDSSLEVNRFPWVFRVHPLEVLDERFLSISNFGIVLDVDVTGIFLDGFAGLALIEHQVVERLRIPFVLL